MKFSLQELEVYIQGWLVVDMILDLFIRIILTWNFSKKYIGKICVRNAFDFLIV